jgi:uncharacterized protein YhaN
VDGDQVRVVEGRLQALRERYRLHEEQLEVRRLAREVIAQARDEVVADVTSAIGPRLDALLGQLTGGRYGHLELDAAMTPTVTAPATGEPLAVPADPADQDASLSCATREQVFLAVRLAIVEMLWSAPGPPLLLDDPLVNFDPDRREAALEVIRATARERQVLLFTCGHDYDGCADHVIALPGGA